MIPTVNPFIELEMNHLIKLVFRVGLGRLAALDGSFGGAAAPPYPVTVGRTCRSAVASRPPTQRRWGSRAVAAPFVNARTVEPLNLEGPPLPAFGHPLLHSEWRRGPGRGGAPVHGEGVRAGGALQGHHRVESVVHSRFPLPRGEGSRVRGKGASNVPLLPGICVRHPQSGFSLCLETGRQESRPSSHGLL
jgi:hypothetical protein